jgi:hypothetical protein
MGRLTCVFALMVAVVAILIPFGAWTTNAQEPQKPEAGKVLPDDAARQRELLDIIKQLQDEVRQLRRELDQLKAERAADREKPRRLGEEDEHARKAEKQRKKKAYRDGETPLLKSSGVIKDVSSEGKAQRITFVVKEDGKAEDMTCVLGEATPITLDGKEAAFDDLKVGDYVEVEYILKGEKLSAVARSISAKRGTVLEKGK